MSPVDYHAWTHRPKALGGTDPIEFDSDNYAVLAIPDGQTIADGSLDVVVNYNRSEVVGTALSVNATSGLITFEETGVYDIHTWVEMDNQGAWVVVEGPVFQGGQDFQDIGNGLLVHVTHPNFSVLQHKTTIVAYDVLNNIAPAGVNLQVLHERGSSDDLFNGGITVVKIANVG